MQQVNFTYKASGNASKDRNGGLLGGIVDPDFENKHADKWGFVMEPHYTVTLSDLFERYNMLHIIDYLSLDIEGAGSYIMKDFPFQHYKMKIMMIEWPKDDLQELLNKNGYVFLQKI